MGFWMCGRLGGAEVLWQPSIPNILRQVSQWGERQAELTDRVYNIAAERDDYKYNNVFAVVVVSSAAAAAAAAVL